jgi:GT2 family glycosyltransferase
MKWPLVSVVFLNYNGKKFANLWRSLFRVEYPNYEIIFVDNGSVDGSDKLFKKLAKKYKKSKIKRLKIIKLENNVGYSKANNIGVKEARGKYIVLLSNDIEVDKYWLKNMINFLEKNKDVGVAQSFMFNFYKRNEKDRMGNFIDVIGYNTCYDNSIYSKNEPFEIFYSEGAVMFIRKDILKETDGLFDEEYFMFFEDVDFCWRVHLRNYKIYMVPSSFVYHVRGGTVEGIVMKLNSLYLLTNTRNRLLTLFKNYGTKNLFKYLPILLFLELLEGIWLFTKKPRLGLSVLCGICDFIFKIPKAYNKRKIVQSLRIVEDNNIIKKMTPLSKSLFIILKVKNEVRLGK